MGFDMNYKIKVANESGNREVQDLFRELGGEWGSRVDSDHYDKEFLYLTNGIIEYDDSISEFESVDECEEITLPELRDLVVLKRNSIEDATHTGKHGSLWYLGFNKYGWRFDIGDNGEWELDNPKNKTVYFGELKPIEKKEMKEYLEPMPNGDYRYHKDDGLMVGGDWIEIPDGADVAIKFKDGPDGFGVIFYKNNGKSCFGQNDKAWQNDADWTMKDLLNENYCEDGIDFSHYILWQRESPNDKLASAEQYRQAEVLPFIDDEPDFKKLADLLVETTKHKPTAREWDLSDYDFAESDAWIESNIEQDNVNNPSHYADGEIECIDAIQSSMTHEAFCGYLKGNIQKYIWRYEKKGGIESLKKGQWYLDKLISVL